MKLELDIPQIPEPSVEVRGLLYLVLKAHADSARENDCVSSAAVKNCNAGNHVKLNGIASAILTLGKKHGPVTEARHLWVIGVESLQMALDEGQIVSGFGNSFYPDGDPKWFDVRRWLMENFPDHFESLEEMESAMFVRSPNLHANAAMYTAICCDLLRIPVGQEALIFILGRLPVWFTL